MDELGQNCLGIKEWYRLEDAPSIIVDIVAVHGFAANPYWTWVGKPQETKRSVSTGKRRQSHVEGAVELQRDHHEVSPKIPVFWLQTLLPKFVPQSRIITFGYQSNYLRLAPKRDIANCALELLLALNRSRAHESVKVSIHSRLSVSDRHSGKEKTDYLHRSLVRRNNHQRSSGSLSSNTANTERLKALVKATLAAQHFGAIRQSTHGVVFLGTPHHGANISSYGETLVTIAKAVGLGSDKTLIHTLREKSPELLKLATNFTDIYDAFEIFCFYELLPWKFSSVVVGQSSAVIEGRLSDGLTVDHSGLNKYSDEQDPNLIKIGNVVADMCKSAKSKLEGSPATSTDNSIKQWPWEVASMLASNIEHAFQILIQTLQAHRVPQRDAEKLIIQKYRFESWAYATGLTSMLGFRLPLHEQLAGTICENVCDLLRQIFQALDTQGQIENVRRTALSVGALSIQLRNLFEMLSALLPEEDQRIVSETFVSRILVPDSDEASFDSFARDASSQPSDLEAVAAMKRIMLLSQQAEAKRSTENQLSIPFNDLSLDKSRSSMRSTGILKSESDGQHSYKIMVEWKKYEGFWSTEIGNQLFHRVELLTEFLKTASRSSETLDLRILECLGYCHDDRKKRIGFVYTVPKSVSGHRSHTRLHALMKESNERQINSPPVGDRMQLGQLLCKAMFKFHQAQWFHKSFSSYNVVFFPDNDDDVEEAEGQGKKSLDVSDYSVLAPYIVGFDHSRPSKPTEFSEPAAGPSSQLRRYWHPDYKNVPTQKYRHEFDYYSLGIVLLEVGLWAPLENIVDEFDEEAADHYAQSSITIAKAARASCSSALSSFMGSIYQGVVSDLLNAFDPGEEAEGMAQNEQAPLGKLIDFQARVLEQLGQCKA